MIKAKHKLNKAMSFTSLSRWMIPPAKGWQAKSRGGLISSGVYWPSLYLVFVLFSLVLLHILTLIFNIPTIFISATSILLVILAVSILFVILGRVEKNLILPLTHVRHWAGRIRGGNLTATIPVPKEQSEFCELATDINQLSVDLRKLTQNMQEQVRIQTQRTAEKSHSLSILYDVAININQAKDINELLSRFTRILKALPHVEASAVRILSDENYINLAAYSGLAKGVIASEERVSVDRCRCGEAIKSACVKTQPVSQCNKILNSSLFDNDSLDMIAVPMMYRDNCLGIYNLYVKESELMDREELSGLLTSIGQHMGLAIAKNQLEVHTKRLALMEERTFLSHELHDSLAQTLVSVKFQAELLKQSYQEKNSKLFTDELQRLEAGLDKANKDLRDLLDHFRAHMDERGLIPAIRELINNLQIESAINCYFQDDSNGLSLPPDHEVQILHIVQEALSNIRKHSQAKNIRIIIRAEKQNWYVLIEDDGIGLNIREKKPNHGENIGLAIMRERAAHINGDIQFESESHEGTRIELHFSLKPNLQHSNIVNFHDFVK